MIVTSSSDKCHLTLMKLILSVTFTADEEYENGNQLSSESVNPFRASQLTLGFELIVKS